MPDYQNGKVYAIRSFLTDIVYVGSTTVPLSRRMVQHRCDYNNTSGSRYKTSAEILKLGDAYIELLENYPCNSREELSKKEGEYIRKLDCVNKRIAGRTPSEYQTAYYQANKERIDAQTALYRQANKEKIKARSRAYQQANREKLTAYQAVWYQAKKNKLADLQTNK